jgi:hypothetical protein
MKDCFISSMKIATTKPAWAGFKTAEEGRAKIIKLRKKVIFIKVVLT